jgi:uncharacterized protein (TIGR00730 family)
MSANSIPAPRSVAVFCGSRHGFDPAYTAAAQALGTGLARAGLRLVYGGGQVGLMGVVADAVLAGGGRVLGIIPDFLRRREVAHAGLVDLIVTESMHDRKRQMFEAADAFVTMPGGFGTFDETIEITTWRQLGLHNKPVLICDVAGWAQPYLTMLSAAIGHGFADPSCAGLYEVLADVPAVLARLSELARPGVGQPERV